ncbi:hypothetical protein ACJX0J_015527 [Zea mays]
MFATLIVVKMVTTSHPLIKKWLVLVVSKDEAFSHARDLTFCASLEFKTLLYDHNTPRNPNLIIGFILLIMGESLLFDEDKKVRERERAAQHSFVCEVTSIHFMEGTLEICCKILVFNFFVVYL